MVVEGLQERSRLKRMEELRRFIPMNNHEAVKLADLEKTLESLLVVKLQFTTEFLEPVVREGVDELTLRREREGMLRTFLDTANAGLVNEDWHAICQAIYKGFEEAEWENL